MSLSTHILDTARGRPAAGVPLVLYERRTDSAGAAWIEIGSGRTDSDGRCKTLLGNHVLAATEYKIAFNTAAYFSAQQVDGLYPFVEIVFTVRDPREHFHIPLLLTPNSYTTYRGS